MHLKRTSQNNQLKVAPGYQIGNIIVKVSTNELIIDDRCIELEDKIMSVLIYLIEHRDRIVSREELFAHVWSEVFVSQDALNRCISILRKVMNDSSSSPKFIRTIRNRGYRLISAVQEIQLTESGTFGNRAAIRPLRKIAYVGSGIAITLTTGLLLVVIGCLL